MEKNKQVLDFGDIIMEIDPGLVSDYKVLRSMFLDFIEYIGMSWESYTHLKTKREIVGEFKHFSLYYYLPF